MEVKWLNVEEKWETLPAEASNTNGKESKNGLEQFLKENRVGGSAYQKLVDEGVETVEALFLLNEQDVSAISSLTIGHKRLIIQILEQSKKAQVKSDPLFSKLQEKGIGEELIPAILSALRDKGGVSTAEQLEQLEQEDVDELGLAILPRKALRGILKQKQQSSSAISQPAPSFSQPAPKKEEKVQDPHVVSMKDAMAMCVRAGLVRGGQDLSALDESGRPPLVRAATEGDVAKLKMLVAAGAPIDAEDKHGCTAVHWAAANGKGTTPAWNAAFHGRHVILEILAERGADLRRAPVRGKYAGKTPYSIAEERGHSEEARLIEQKQRD